MKSCYACGRGVWYNSITKAGKRCRRDAHSPKMETDEKKESQTGYRLRKGIIVKQIKKLELNELKRIYKAHVREDFPRSERRPYASMEKMTHAGKYASYGYLEDDNLLAYACFILTNVGTYALLDYFAVIPELRGQGTGSEFLKHLKDVAPAKNGAFIEAESTDSANTDADAQLRKRRIHF